MDKPQMTVAEARRLLGVKTDYKLAQLIGRNRASVSRWGRMVPEHVIPLIWARRADILNAVRKVSP